MTVERDWFWFWFWFYYALWLASVFTLVLVLRQSSENRSIYKYQAILIRKDFVVRDNLLLCKSVFRYLAASDHFCNRHFDTI